jgi:Transcription factor zinc-finger
VISSAREDIYFAQKDRELIAQLREKDQQELEGTILELCHLRCPKCGRKLEETIYRDVRIDRCIGCGGYGSTRASWSPWRPRHTRAGWVSCCPA